MCDTHSSGRRKELESLEKSWREFEEFVEWLWQRGSRRESPDPAAPVPEALIRSVVHAPVLLLVFADLAYVASFDSELERIGVISGASVYPFVWNILLAARNEGLGGTLTTFAAAAEPAVQALVGVPAHFAFTALLPIGRPLRQLTKLTRKPVAEFVRLERWDGPRLGS